VTKYFSIFFRVRIRRKCPASALSDAMTTVIQAVCKRAQVWPAFRYRATIPTGRDHCYNDHQLKKILFYQYIEFNEEAFGTGAAFAFSHLSVCANGFYTFEDLLLRAAYRELPQPDKFPG
jgi:hypothetical protein